MNTPPDAAELGAQGTRRLDSRERRGKSARNHAINHRGGSNMCLGVTNAANFWAESDKNGSKSACNKKQVTRAQTQGSCRTTVLTSVFVDGSEM